MLIFWLAIFIILPSFYFKSTYEGFEYPKFILTFSIFLITILILLTGSLRKNPSQIVLKFYGADFIILGFFIVYLLSLSFSISWYTSLLSGWGPPQGGLLFLIICFGFYFFLRLFNYRSLNLKQISWSIILGASASLIIGQLGYFEESTLFELGTRIIGTQKNPIFFSSYLMLSLPIALVLLISVKKLIYKIFLTFFLVVILINLLLLLTRSVWITTIISLIILLKLIINTKQISLKKLLLNRYSIVIVLVLILAVIPLLPFVENRISGTFDLQSPSQSLVIRSYEYSSALKIIKDYPFLGVGPEALDHIYPRYRSVELNKVDNEWDLGTPQIRNYYLHLATTIGLGGALAFGLIIINFVWQFLKSFKSFLKDEQVLLIGLFTSWLMIVIHYLFYGASLTSQVFFWVLFAIISSKLIAGTKHFPLFNLKLDFLDYKIVLKISLNKTLISFGLVMVIFFQLLLALDFYSNYLFMTHFLAKDIDQKIAYLEQAIKINPTRSHYYRFLVDSTIVKTRELLARSDTDLNQVSNLLTKSQIELDKAKLLDSTDPEVFRQQAAISFFKFRAAKREGVNFEDEFEVALLDIKSSQSLEPTSPILQDWETQLYLERSGEYLTQALDSVKKTLTLKSNYAPALYHLGEIYKQLGNLDLAILSYQETLKFDPNDEFAKQEIKKIEALKDR